MYICVCKCLRIFVYMKYPCVHNTDVKFAQPFLDMHAHTQTTPIRKKNKGVNMKIYTYITDIRKHKAEPNPHSPLSIYTCMDIKTYLHTHTCTHAHTDTRVEQKTHDRHTYVHM